MAEIQGHLTLVGDDFDTALVSKMLGRLPTYVREKTEVLGNGQEMLDCSAELLKKAAHDCNAEWSILYYAES